MVKFLTAIRISDDDRSDTIQDMGALEGVGCRLNDGRCKAVCYSGPAFPFSGVDTEGLRPRPDRFTSFRLQTIHAGTAECEFVMWVALLQFLRDGS
jgi:hypothetical protein